MGIRVADDGWCCLISRSFSEIQSYAERLHHVDPQCKDPIPVSPEEAFEI